MDGRTALAPGTQLAFRNREGGAVSYVVRREIGRGGSCIVYDASYIDNLGNQKLVRVKECYPHALSIVRDEGGALRPDARDAEDFKARKQRFVEAYQRHHTLFCLPALTNAVPNTSDIYMSNGTVYIVSSFTDNVTLADHHPSSLRQALGLIADTGRILAQIHEAGYLYLDLKPENILVLSGDPHWVQLFDFDSMIPREAVSRGELQGLRTSYTRGFAPLEQETGKLRRLGPWSDVFSLGAVLFYALFGRIPAAFDCEFNVRYDYSAMVWADIQFQDALYRELTHFFHRTLASFPGDRYPTMAAALSQLERLERLCDEGAPWLISTPLQAPVFFAGRQAELSALHSLLHRPGQPLAAVTGLGGIGKSTLVKQYLALHRQEYDAVLFLYEPAPAQALLTDDGQVRVHGLEKLKEEAREDHLKRKLNALKGICASGRVLLVLDNFEQAYLSELELLCSVGWQILLISRSELPDGFCPSLRLGELDAAALRALFLRYARRGPEAEEDAEAFLTIADCVDGHTLLMELIARQIARNYLDLPQAAALAERYGFRRVAAGRVDYIRDHSVMRTTIEGVLTQLLELDRYAADEKRIIKLLSLFDAPGVPAPLFAALAQLKDMDTVNALEDSGWLKAEGGRLSLHPVLREFVDGWPWRGEERYLEAAEALMERLYAGILPPGQPDDADKQTPEDYSGLLALLSLAEEIVTHLGERTPASQRLRFRLLMDAPVDADQAILDGVLELLEDPQPLQANCILRLYLQAALLLFRLNYYQDAMEMLEEMRAFLEAHESAYYRSLYHNTRGNMLHDLDPKANLDRCMQEQDAAIVAARSSRRPEAPMQLATSLLDKCMTLLDLSRQPELCGRLLHEAAEIIDVTAGGTSYPRYHWLCIAAMYHARVTGDAAKGRAYLEEATAIADVARDFAMSYIDHLADQSAPILFEMGCTDEALSALSRAIELCEEYPDVAAYRSKRFDALLFLARLYAELGSYTRSAEIYDQLELCREDCPYSIDPSRPLCPPDVRRKAREGADGP